LSSATLVTTCENTATSWPRNVLTWKSDVTFSANMWFALGIYYQLTSSKHHRLTLSKTVTICGRVGLHKAAASTPHIYKSKYKYTVQVHLKCALFYAQHDLFFYAHPCLNKAHIIFVYFVSQKITALPLLAPWPYAPSHSLPALINCNLT